MVYRKKKRKKKKKINIREKEKERKYFTEENTIRPVYRGREKTMVSRFRNARKSVQVNKGETASGQKEKRSKRTYRRKGSHDSLSLEFLRVTTNKTEFDQFSPSTECVHSFASCSCSLTCIYTDHTSIFSFHMHETRNLLDSEAFRSSREAFCC